MVVLLYKKLAPYLCGFFMLTTCVFFFLGFIRSEQIVSLQTELLKNKQQEVKVIVEQQEVAIKISQAYEERKADKIQEKIYVDREVEKIISVPSYSNECFDASGMLSLNSYIASINGSGKSETALPKDSGDN